MEVDDGARNQGTVELDEPDEGRRPVGRDSEQFNATRSADPRRGRGQLDPGGRGRGRWGGGAEGDDQPRLAACHGRTFDERSAFTDGPDGGFKLELREPDADGRVRGARVADGGQGSSIRGVAVPRIDGTGAARACRSASRSTRGARSPKPTDALPSCASAPARVRAGAPALGRSAADARRARAAATKSRAPSKSRSSTATRSDGSCCSASYRCAVSSHSTRSGRGGARGARGPGRASIRARRRSSASDDGSNEQQRGQPIARGRSVPGAAGGSSAFEGAPGFKGFHDSHYTRRARSCRGPGPKPSRARLSRVTTLQVGCLGVRLPAPCPLRPTPGPFVP